MWNFQLAAPVENGTGFSDENGWVGNGKSVRPQGIFLVNKLQTFVILFLLVHWVQPKSSLEDCQV